MNATPSIAARAADWKTISTLSFAVVWHIKQAGDLALRKELSVVVA